MKKVYLITLEDIQTQACGFNIEINTKNGETLNFTQEAFDEFVNDVKFMRDNGHLKEVPIKKDKI
jgi:hypothetical protein